MPRIATFVLCLVLPLAAAAQEPAEDIALVTEDGTTATLEQFLWVARPLVIFADAAADPRFAEQIELLAVDPMALTDRDVVVLIDTDPAAMSPIRTELRPRGFMIALLAKDGTVVLRKPFPWDVREITHAIDKLPLRKQELSRSRTLTD